MDAGQVTQLLQQASEGDQEASARLIQLVYAELHRLAARCMSGERGGHILQPTALVNETYLRLFGSGERLKLNNRGHFFAVVATQMRRILVDDARSRHTRKREGIEIELDEAFHVTAEKGRRDRGAGRRAEEAGRGVSGERQGGGIEVFWRIHRQ